VPDLIDQIFGDEPEGEEEQFYPGSKKKRREKKPTIEFVPEEWRDNYVTKWLKGKETRMYPVGALATALGVSVQTVRRWSTQGKIPQAPFRLAANMMIDGRKVPGRRYYTQPLIEAVVDVFTERGIIGQGRIVWDEHEDVPIEIHEKWTRIINQSNQGEASA
jgi:hypothetical protein